MRKKGETFLASLNCCWYVKNAATFLFLIFFFSIQHTWEQSRKRCELDKELFLLPRFLLSTHQQRNSFSFVFKTAQSSSSTFSNISSPHPRLHTSFFRHCLLLSLFMHCKEWQSRHLNENFHTKLSSHFIPLCYTFHTASFLPFIYLSGMVVVGEMEENAHYVVLTTAWVAVVETRRRIRAVLHGRSKASKQDEKYILY